MTKPTIMTVVGTRPEIIRLSRLIPKFDEAFNHILIHTGQNYDRMLSDIFFQELQIRPPDEFLNIDHSSLGKTLGDLFTKFEESLIKFQPDGVFILGDTNSALVAILAKRMHIPVYHWEAGNRSFDENVPEETNRKIVDHTAHFNIAYSHAAEANLIAEGISRDRIRMSGSPMKEVLDYYAKQIDQSEVLKLESLKPKEYFVASFHRQENVDNPIRLRQIVESLSDVARKWGYPVIISTHPRTKGRINDIQDLKKHSQLIFHEPLGYFDYVKLQKNSLCVLSDSGTISEESAILGFPAVTIRDSMERPEALIAGTIIMSGVSTESVTACVVKSIEKEMKAPPAEYLISDASNLVLDLVATTVYEYAAWSGVKRLNKTNG